MPKVLEGHTDILMRYHSILEFDRYAYVLLQKEIRILYRIFRESNEMANKYCAKVSHLFTGVRRPVVCWL